MNTQNTLLKTSGLKHIIPLLALLAAPSANANLIDDTYGVGAGSFELGNFVQEGSNHWDHLAPGSTSITGWTVGGPGDGVDWKLSPTFSAHTGTYSVDLTHTTASSISTVIATTIGGLYQLDFVGAAMVAELNTGLVSAGTLVNQAFTPTISPLASALEWTSYSYTFQATEANTTITFAATGSTSDPWRFGPAIDSVSVTAADVPLPGALSLMGLGLLGLGATRLRKQK